MLAALSYAVFLDAASEKVRNFQATVGVFDVVG